MSDRPSSLLDAVAAKIRGAYIAEVRHQHQQRKGLPSNYVPPVRWDGGKDAAGAHHQPIWPKIAKLVLEKNLDPVAYVRAQFEKFAQVPPPGVLLTPRALERYQHEVEFAGEEIRRAYPVQLHRAVVEVGCRLQLGTGSELDVWLEVLWNQQFELSALFRYCMAAKLLAEHGQLPQLRELLRAYEVSAAVQYRRHPRLYREVWQGLIPKSFRQRARQLVREAVKESA